MSGEQLLVAVPTTGRRGGGLWYRLLPNRISDEERAADLAMAAAVAGTACSLTVSPAKTKQQPWQRLRRTERGEGGERPAGAAADTVGLTVSAVKG